MENPFFQISSLVARGWDQMKCSIPKVFHDLEQEDLLQKRYVIKKGLTKKEAYKRGPLQKGYLVKKDTS